MRSVVDHKTPIVCWVCGSEKIRSSGLCGECQRVSPGEVAVSPDFVKKKSNWVGRAVLSARIFV